MSISIRALLLSAAVALPGLALAASPTPVQFSAKGAAATQADQVYAAFLRSHPKARLEAASLDLWHGHTSVLAVRFVDPSTCTGDECHTVLLDQVAGRWHEMMAQRLSTLAVMPHPAAAPANLMVDGRHVWQRLADTFVPQIQSYIDGAPMVASTPVDASHAAVMASYLGAAKAFVMQSVKVGGKLGTIDVVQPTGVNCGEAGCPMVVFGNQHPVLSTTSPGLFGLAPGADTVDGVRGLVVAVVNGLDFYRWDTAAGKYEMTRTTYTSSVTPVP